MTYLTPEQVCELVPGMTKGVLAERRYKRLPPVWIKPSSRVIVYEREMVDDWLRGSRADIGTATMNDPPTLSGASSLGRNTALALSEVQP